MKDHFVDVKDAYKATQIKDQFGNLRYVVCMAKKFQEIYDNNTGASIDTLCHIPLEWDVSVVSYYGHPNPLVIDKKSTCDYHRAIAFFDEAVKDYTHVIECETKNYQDIAIYAEKIEYKMADCCKTCKFVKFNPVLKQLECHCLDNFKEYVKPETASVNIHPRVDACGICKSFDRSFIPC